MPDVSIVIPTYDRRGFLEKALQSCFAGHEALDVEAVVVDDGSTDGTRDWLRQLDDERVRPFFQEHQGAQVARNRGMEEALGTFVKFLDDDDELVEGALTEEVEALQEADADVSYGHLVFVGPDGERWTHRQGEAFDFASGIFVGKIKTHPCVLLYRRSILKSLRWDPALAHHQDKAFALEVATQCQPSVRVDRPVGVHDKHTGASISNDVKAVVPKTEILLSRINSTYDAVERLRNGNNLKVHHEKAATSGIWMWAHMLSAYDLDAFEESYAKVRALDPTFEPPRASSALATLDRLVSPTVTEKVLYPLRAFKRRVAFS